MSKTSTLADIVSANGTLIVPTGNTAGRPSATAGSIRFNTDLNTLESANGSAWANVGSGSASSGGGRQGGFTSNPDFVACLKKNGVTPVAGQRLDRTDPKVSAALQACFSQLGGTGGFGGGRPSGAPAAGSTSNP